MAAWPWPSLPRAQRCPGCGACRRRRSVVFLALGAFVVSVQQGRTQNNLRSRQQMLFKLDKSRCRIALQGGVHDATVLVAHVAVIGVKRLRQASIAFALLIQQCAHAMQPDTWACANERFMELAVRLIPGIADPGFRVGRGVLETLHSVSRPNDSCFPFHIAVLDRFAQAERFDLDARACEVEQFLRADSTDTETTMGLCGNHAFRTE